MELIYKKDKAFADEKELLRECVADLESKGYVKKTYLDSILAREATYPTGIESTVNFALCHTEITHVTDNCLYVINLEKSIEFGNMAEPGQKLDVKLVFILVFNSPSAHLSALQSIVAFMSEKSKVESFVKLNEVDGLNYLKEEL